MIKDKNSVLVGPEAKSYTRGIKKGGGGELSCKNVSTTRRFKDGARKKRWYFHHPVGILNFNDESERTNSIKMFREFLSKLNKICLSVNTMDAMGIQASTTFPIRLCMFRKQRMELQNDNDVSVFLS